MPSDNSGFSEKRQESPKCSRDRAAMLIAQMLSGFPQQEANDPEGYIANLVTIALTYAEEAVAAVVERSFAFLPSRYEWRKALDIESVRLMRVRNMQNARMIEMPPIEYVRLPPEPDPDVDPLTGKHPPGTILREYQRWIGLYGRPLERTT